ncbi:MAG: HAMP domain-containing protein [Rhodospirillales bacterium]|nr:HAMP domain-containing protein [Rhodospirillales bacterium]MBT4040476.1 HAMP domain-containing protein [Rhodospirillales bacterium]MBT4626870.1 HAMP domain-containing protein [Rhodospirillales bacterium]MBT5350754.1 HAMP domain-containing protein [Rhodospirillales bacterium]MBT5521405.1 HAMP domain-containing protein [Rhodospirillales bacterium]
MAEPYLDLRAQDYADKSFLGGTPLSTRTAMFFFIGVLAMAALAVIYVYVDDRLARSLSTWKDAQRISSSVSALNTAIEDVRVQDRRARENRDAAVFQAHRRAVDRVALALGTLQGIEHTSPIHDAAITIRDAFGEYGSEFSATMENRAVLGATKTTGIRAQRHDAARNVREAMEKYGLKALLADFDALDGEADVEPAPNNTEDRDRIAAEYEKLNTLISKSTVDAAVKAELQQLLRTHASVLVAINDTRSRLESAPQEFEEILDYIGPALRQVAEFSSQFGRDAPAAFEREHLLARQITAFSSAGAILFLILSGVVLMRSISKPLLRLVEATEQLARGDRFMTVPLRGNSDAIGRMARALDNWLDHLAEVDHMRAELDDARMRLSVDAAMRTAEFETAPANDAGSAEGAAEDIKPEPVVEDRDGTAQVGQTLDNKLPPEPTPEEAMEEFAAQNAEKPVDNIAPEVPAARSSGLGVLGGIPGEAKPAMGAMGAMGDRSSSSIGAASKHLTQISEYVTAATVDVERTESLIQTLADTARQLVDLEICVSTIRDEANLIVFRSNNRSDSDKTGDKGDDNLVYLSSDRDGTGTGAATGTDSPRFNTIRDAVSRAERLVVSVRKSLDSVTTVAHEIASTASNEALDATNKLLSQSEYLQHMLDDLVTRIAPVKQDLPPTHGSSASHPSIDGDV